MRAGGPPPKPGAPAPAATPTPAAAAAPAAGAPQTGLRAQIEQFVGAAVHGDVTVRYRARWSHEETDQDLYQYLNLRVGEEWRDELSATFFVRGTLDLDQDFPRENRRGFTSLADGYDSRWNANLYTAYLTWRPKGGWLDTARLGRQYVQAAETFHIDGVSVETQPLVKSIDLRATVYGGRPVHLYESSPSGDWLAGAQLAATPVKGTRGALDYTYVKDDLRFLGPQRDDLAALSVWQDVGRNFQLHGRVSYLEGLRDYTLRGTANFPEHDLIVHASYFQLLERKKQFVTEFDPYFSVLRSQERFEQADLRAAKGFGEHFAVEAGGSTRQLQSGADEGPFNRNVRRMYVTPSVSDLPWEGFEASVTAENWSGDGERIRTFGAEAGHKFSKKLKATLGTDYSLYALGPLGFGERNHVRSVYARVRMALTESLSADIGYEWEKDDEETTHAVTLALTVEF